MSGDLTRQLLKAVKQLHVEAFDTRRHFERQGKYPPSWTVDVCSRSVAARDYLHERLRRRATCPSD